MNDYGQWTSRQSMLKARVAELERDYRSLREHVEGVRKWAAGLLGGNIEAQLVVDELDYAC